MLNLKRSCFLESKTLNTIAGFTPQQSKGLDALFDRWLKELLLYPSPAQRSSAPPSARPLAPKPCALTPPELPPLPPTKPPPARTYPLSPSVKAAEEYEQVPLRNIKPIAQKHRASNALPRIRVIDFSENCIM